MVAVLPVDVVNLRSVCSETPLTTGIFELNYFAVALPYPGNNPDTTVQSRQPIAGLRIDTGTVFNGGKNPIGRANEPILFFFQCTNVAVRRPRAMWSHSERTRERGGQRRTDGNLKNRVPWMGKQSRGNCVKGNSFATARHGVQADAASDTPPATVDTAGQPNTQ